MHVGPEIYVLYQTNYIYLPMKCSKQYCAILIQRCYVDIEQTMEEFFVRLLHEHMSTDEFSIGKTELTNKKEFSKFIFPEKKLVHAIMMMVALPVLLCDILSIHYTRAMFIVEYYSCF